MSNLILTEKEKIEKQVIAETSKSEEVDPKLQAQADELVDKLVGIDLRNLDQRDAQARAVANLGETVTRNMAQQSAMLKQPMANLLRDAQDGGPVAQGLLTLQEQVTDINPNRVDFNMGGFRRLLSMIPGVGTPLARWFARYQSVEGVIQDIVATLKDGKSQLERDNVTLRNDQKRMRELTFLLQDYIKLGQLLDRQLTSQVERQEDEEKRKFLEEEVLFPLRQRIIDLQQMLAVNQQGVLSTEVIIRNNQELVRGVDRACNVTVTALSTASTLALALQAQKKVLKGVQAVTQTTNDLIAETASTLRTQGVEIQKQASQAQLDINTLKKAFTDVQAALEELSSFRRNALPKMAQSIVDMDDLSGKMEKSIQKMEGAEEARVSLEDAIEIIDINKE
ncbi:MULTISPECIES: toxic anion resistance protein [unclassified Hahella]|uniref:toxic anion resistance protein n=1 Tax=unclassified Hahella TaxID=2624107 RepID=UPI001C1EF692|nr:toxic anion resistance protein [Hahella sp. CR1]MBU6950077.1 toxic anion resistance protein [Hahella sp. HN01]MDG9671145.1 toxic anion resistance protein [Hahella sp. CR1]